MNPKDFTLVNPIGVPVANFKSLENAFKAAQKMVPTYDKFNDVINEMNEDGDVLLDSGFSIYKKGVTSS